MYRDALTQGLPGLEFVEYGNISTSVTTGYGVAAAVPLLPCAVFDNPKVLVPSVDLFNGHDISEV